MMSDNPPPQNEPSPPPSAANDPYPRPTQAQTTTVDHIIPAKNPPALIAYYLGVFSIIPFAGLLMGAGGIWLGVKGIQGIKANPGLPGKTHASVGIGCGLIGLLFNIAIVVVMVMAALSVSVRPMP